MHNEKDNLIFKLKRNDEIIYFSLLYDFLGALFSGCQRQKTTILYTSTKKKTCAGFSAFSKDRKSDLLVLYFSRPFVDFSLFDTFPGCQSYKKPSQMFFAIIIRTFENE